MILLTSNRLRIEIAEPNAYPNTGYRFDRAGFITEVILDDSVRFCAGEPQNLSHPFTGGRGLCCEYKADYSGEVKQGEYYPKLGVGLIKKKGAYCFYEKYEDVLDAEILVKNTETMAEFITKPHECKGYAVEIVKKISVEDNRLIMNVAARNVGEKKIVTEEYCHNFLSIDGMAISPEYCLVFPDLRLKSQEIKNMYPTPCNYVVNEKGISFARAELQVSLAELPMDGYQEKIPFRWELFHKGAKAGVKVQEYLSVSGIVLWSVDHIVSPEIFHKICIKPGESCSWCRIWEFYREK